MFHGTSATENLLRMTTAEVAFMSDRRHSTRSEHTALWLRFHQLWQAAGEPHVVVDDYHENVGHGREEPQFSASSVV